MKRKIYDKLLEWKQVPQFPFNPYVEEEGGILFLPLYMTPLV